MYIPVILGTNRPGRQSEKPAKFMLEEVLKSGLETELIDVADFAEEAVKFEKESPKIKMLAEKISKADGFIIVAPEYNHGYPGILKAVLDLFYDQYAKKPVGFCGVSVSKMGGARVVEQLRLVSIEFHMAPIREAIYFSEVSGLFDENNKIKNPAYLENVKKFLAELVWYAQALKKAREEK